MATLSSILAWRILWTEEPVGLQSMGSQSQTRLKRLIHHYHHLINALEFWSCKDVSLVSTSTNSWFSR